ncbi:uncharacterized protein LOC141620485 [Silene latifolia]|uniref:uncharacterized protein LOC141620485 n=1 Tax=Silene latifolia TaxID=37657 RepID=UPI003D7733B7
MNAQVITAQVTELATRDNFLLSIVYGSNDYVERQDLWTHLRTMKNQYHGPWGVCGDFNNVLNFNERIGSEVLWANISDFRDCVHYCGFNDIKGRGAFFTWNNKQAPATRVFSKIDRFLVNVEWMDLYPNSYAHFLPEGLFDHTPIVCYKSISVEKRKAETDAAESYRHLCKMHHSFLYQKAKADWLSHGDENSKFFNSQIRASLLGSSMPTKPVHMPTVRKGKLLTEEHHSLLLAAVTDSEIKDCLFDIGSSKSPEPDGFSSQFFKDSWETVRGDVTAAIKDFFQTGQLLKQVNTTTLTLIPKNANPTSVLEFCPIACCNTIDKILAKVLCNRLAKVLPDIVSENHGGFVKGRIIVENVLICQDLVRLYNRKAASPRCLIKKDLKKAYDSVEWDFLDQMLVALKFHKHFIDLVIACVTSPTYSLILVIVALQEDFRFHPLCGSTRLNHLLFADDLLLFCKGNDSYIIWMLRAFATFSAASGLCLNKAKSEIYFNGVKTDTVNAILQVYGFHRGTLPFRNFLWGASSDYNNPPNISWDICCMPKDEGGIGIKEAKIWNKALLGKYVWWLTNKKDHLWQAYVSNKWLNSSKEYYVKAGYDWLRGSHPKVDWSNICWNHFNLPKSSFICWEYMHINVCLQEIDCSGWVVLLIQVQELVHCFSTVRRLSKLQKRFIGACHVALIYRLWRFRNEAKMNAIVRRPEVLVSQVLHDIKARVLALNNAPLLSRDQAWFQNL